MAQFVDAFSSATGRPHRVPAHFIGHEVLGADLTTSPPPNAHLEDARPTEQWTIAQLSQYAAAHDIDLAGATRKHADILASRSPTTPPAPRPRRRGEPGVTPCLAPSPTARPSSPSSPPRPPTRRTRPQPS